MTLGIGDMIRQMIFMNIAIDARPLGAQLTGIEYYCRSILVELEKMDKENHYYLFSDIDFTWIPENPRWHKVLIDRPTWMPVSSIWFFLCGYSLKRRYKIDVVWTAWPQFFFGMSVRTIITVHDLVWFFAPATMRTSVWLLNFFYSGFSIIFADHLCCVSRTTAEGLKKFYPFRKNRISYTNNAVDALLYYPRVKQEAQKVLLERFELQEKFLLHVGTNQPRKNLVRLINAFDAYADEDRDIHLVLVGASGWREGSFFKTYQGLKNRDRIKIVGYVELEVMPFFYSCAEVYVFPSFYEGFGIPLLEAMACDCPVISSDRSSLPEVAGDAAIYFDPFDEKATVDSIRRILNDTVLQKELVLRGRKRIAQYSWERSAKTVHSLLLGKEALLIE